MGAQRPLQRSPLECVGKPQGKYLPSKLWWRPMARGKQLAERATSSHVLALRSAPRNFQGASLNLRRNPHHRQHNRPGRKKMTTPQQPGWYDDPNDSKAQRYWDGQDWTPHRQRKPISRDTPPVQYARTAVPSRARHARKASPAQPAGTVKSVAECRAAATIPPLEAGLGGHHRSRGVSYSRGVGVHVRLA
jgi:hypothetical protein